MDSKNYINQLEADNEKLREELEKSRKSDDFTQMLLKKVTNATQFFSIKYSTKNSVQEFFYMTEKHAAFHLHKTIDDIGNIYKINIDKEPISITVNFHCLLKPSDDLIELNNSKFPPILEIWNDHRKDAPEIEKIFFKIHVPISTTTGTPYIKHITNEVIIFHFNLINKEIEYLKETYKQLVKMI